jgi:predicted PurR-regulated permease PerM
LDVNSQVIAAAIWHLIQNSILFYFSSLKCFIEYTHKDAYFYGNEYDRKMEIDKVLIKRWMAFVALNLFGVFLIYQLRDFIAPFLGSVIFYVLFSDMMDNLTAKRKWKESRAALLIILLSFIIILIPILVLCYLLYAKISQVINDPASMVNVLHMFGENIKSVTGVEVFSEKNLEGIKVSAGNLIPSFLNQLMWTLGNIGIMYFILFYLLMQREKVTLEVNNYLPFDTTNIKILATELKSMTLSNVIGVPAIATIQGTAAGLGYWIFGLSEPVFWGVITAFVSLLPLMGSTLVWVPAGLFLLALGQTWQGVGLLLYGILVIINIDNVTRFAIQKRFADVHPLITVFGVIIGLDLFGLPGIIFGPLMFSYFVIFIKMYRKVYKVG